MHVIVGEEVGRQAVIAGLVMFQAEMAGVVRQRKQEIVMSVVMCTEQEISLRHYFALLLKLFVGQLHILRRIAHHIQIHRCATAGCEIHTIEMSAGDQW